MPEPSESRYWCWGRGVSLVGERGEGERRMGGGGEENGEILEIGERGGERTIS